MKYYLIAGEASGDLHASRLMRAIKEKDPEAEFHRWRLDGKGWRLYAETLPRTCVYGFHPRIAASQNYSQQYGSMQKGY